MEKKLVAGKGVSRHQLGRLKFIEEVGGATYNCFEKRAISGQELAKGKGRGHLGPIMRTGGLVGLDQKPVHTLQRV